MAARLMWHHGPHESSASLPGRAVHVNPIETTVRRIDAWQQRHAPAAFVFGVVKKFGDDSAGSLAALIAYYGFLSLFPLFLVLITLLGLFFAHDISLQDRILRSAFGQFPIVGNQLRDSGLRSLRAGSVLGLVVGLLGLVWGSFGIAQAAQWAMSQVWNVPGVDRPGFLPRLGRSVEFLALLGLDVVVTTFLAGFVTIGHGALWLQILVTVIGLAVNIALYLVGFRILTPKSVTTNVLIPGAILGGIGWTILQYVGTLLVGHTLRHASQTYGYFGSVIGLISFLYLAAELAVYAAEMNVVRARHLYPRSMAPPPLTVADQAVLSALARQGERRPEQRVSVEFSEPDDGHQEPTESS
jgi:inner membrane protein YhjD